MFYSKITLILLTGLVLVLSGCIEAKQELASIPTVSPEPSLSNSIVSELGIVDINGNSIDIDEYEFRVMADFTGDQNWYQFGYNLFDAESGEFKGLRLGEKVFDRNSGRKEYQFNISKDFPTFSWSVNNEFRIVIVVDFNNTKENYESSFHVNSIPTSPKLEYPFNEMSATVTTRLEIQPSLDVDNDHLRYHFFVDDGDDGTLGIVDPPFTFEGWSENTSITPDNLIEGHTYDWMVISSDGNRESIESDIWKFTAVPYLNSVGIEFSNEAWERVQTFTDPVDGIIDVFYGVNRLYASNRLNVKFNVTSIKKIDQDSDPDTYTYTHVNCEQRKQDYQIFNVYIYIAEDAGWYTGKPCPSIGLKYESNWSLFSYGGIRAFAHELGHFRGVQDFYWMDVPGPQNRVSGLAHTSSMQRICRGDDVPMDEIMQSPYGLDTCFGEYSLYTINKNSNQTLTDFHISVYSEVPEKNYIKITDQNNKPIVDALIKVYGNTHSSEFNSFIDNIPEVTGRTDHEGRFFLTSRSSTDLLDLQFDVLHISITLDGMTKYGWIEIIELNNAFRAGDTESHDYVLRFDQLLKSTVVN